MTTYILDTSTTSLIQRKHAITLTTVRTHRNDLLCVSTVTIEEVWNGCLTLLRRSKSNRETAFASEFFAESVEMLRPYSFIAQSEPSLNRFDALVKMKLNIGKNDLRIAAIALELDATVVTVNVRDFQRVPKLKWEDWSV
jgi:tRNA(fMet)-specific endonuclease VapC